MGRSALHGIDEAVKARDERRHQDLIDRARRGFDLADRSRSVPRLKQRLNALVAAKVRAGHGEDSAIALVAAENPELYAEVQDLETVHLHQQGARSANTDAHGRLVVHDFNARTAFSLGDVPGTSDKYNQNPSDRRTRNAEIEGEGPGKKGNSDIRDSDATGTRKTIQQLDDDSDPDDTITEMAARFMKDSGLSMAAAVAKARQMNPKLADASDKKWAAKRGDSSLPESTY